MGHRHSKKSRSGSRRSDSFPLSLPLCTNISLECAIKAFQPIEPKFCIPRASFIPLPVSHLSPMSREQKCRCVAVSQPGVSSRLFLKWMAKHLRRTGETQSLKYTGCKNFSKIVNAKKNKIAGLPPKYTSAANRNYCRTFSKWISEW